MMTDDAFRARVYNRAEREKERKKQARRRIAGFAAAAAVLLPVLFTCIRGMEKGILSVKQQNESTDVGPTDGNGDASSEWAPEKIERDESKTDDLRMAEVQDVATAKTELEKSDLTVSLFSFTPLESAFASSSNSRFQTLETPNAEAAAVDFLRLYQDVTNGETLPDVFSPDAFPIVGEQAVLVTFSTGESFTWSVRENRFYDLSHGCVYPLTAAQSAALQDAAAFAKGEEREENIP